MAQDKEKENPVTPTGIAAFCHIHKPDKKIWNNRQKRFVETEDEKKWRYKTSIMLDKGVAAVEEFVADLIRRHEELGGEGWPSCLKDGDKKPKKKKGSDKAPEAPAPGKYELRLKSAYPAALILTNGEELPPKVKIKAGDTIAAVISFDESDTEIYTGLVTYLNSVVLVRKSKGHLEAAQRAVAGADFGEDVYIPDADADDEDETDEETEGESAKRKSRSRNY